MRIKKKYNSKLLEGSFGRGRGRGEGSRPFAPPTRSGGLTSQPDRTGLVDVAEQRPRLLVKERHIESKCITRETVEAKLRENFRFTTKIENDFTI